MGQHRPASPATSTILHDFGYHEPLADNQRLAAYQDHKRLTVIAMTADGGGYRYQMSVSTTRRGEPDQTVTGLISFERLIQEIGRQDCRVGCPICLEDGLRTLG